MGHEPDRAVTERRDHARRFVGVACAEPPHAGVELHVHAGVRRERGDEVLAPRDDVGPRVERDRELGRRQRAHHEQRAVETGGPQLGRLAGRGDGEPRRSAGLRRARGDDRAVPVPVGLDDRAQRRQRREAPAVALDRAGIDAGQRPDHQLLLFAGEPVEHVDAGDHADEATVLDDRQPIVLLARDQASGLADRRVGLDRDRAPGSSCPRPSPRTPCARAPRSATTTRGTRSRRTAGNSAAGGSPRPRRTARGRPR